MKLQHLIAGTIIRNLRHLFSVSTQEDKELLKYYRTAFLFANGEILPRVYFNDGMYHIEHLFSEGTKSVTDRQLYRMGKNLIKRTLKSVGINYYIPSQQELYEFLNPIEQMLLDEKVTFTLNHYKIPLISPLP